MNKYLKIALAIMVTVIALSFLKAANAGCLDDSQNGEASTTLSWTPAGEREDGELFPDDENAGYSAHYLDVLSGVKCERRIPDKATQTTDFKIHFNRQYNFTMRQWDTDNRVSQHSDVVVIQIDKEVEPIGQPAPITDLTVTRINDTFDYQFNFSAVTTWDDGTPLPEGAVMKYYYFDSHAITDTNHKGWVADVYMAQIPRTFTLGKGFHTITFETEIQIDGQRTVSQRSVALNLDVQDFVPPVVEPLPPMPPTIINIPAGATSVTVTFE